MAKFCGKCGTHLDPQTGLCPDCDNDIHKKTGTNNKISLVTSFVSVILSVCLFITMFVSVAIFDVRNAIRNENIPKLFDNANYIDALRETEIVNDRDINEFRKYMNNKFGIEITVDELNDFIDESGVKGYIVEKVADFCNDYFDGYAELSISKKELMELINENNDKIEHIFGRGMSDIGIGNMLNWMFDEDELIIMNSYDLEDDSSLLFWCFKYGLSYVSLAIFVILCLLIIFLMIKNNVQQATYGIAICSIVLGIFTGVIAVLATWLPSFWKTLCLGSFYGILTGNLMGINIWVSITVVVLGVVVTLLRKILTRNL